jgi:phosphatidylserine/phosphatidylglycerophosphate/cardiolipin synthase-like enzyme
VVDSRSVVVSSQNFSPAGVETNRDAGVIIESEDIAQYFEPIFRSDWQKAKPAVKTSAKQSKPKTRIPRKPKAKG